MNAYGPIYAVSAGHGQLVVLDPSQNKTEAIDIPTREPRDKVPSRFPAPGRPSLHFGNQHLWANPPYNPADPHNPMIDSKGRVWMTSKIRGNADPSWCNSATNKYADWFPLTTSIRQASYYDPKTKQFTLIDTCYSTHHLQFDNDANETLYFNELIGPIFGWVDTKVFDETKNEQLANGWCGQVLDTNGDGRITKPWNVSRAGNPGLYGGGAASADDAPLDPKLDTHVTYTLYAVIPSPVDDSVWGVSEQYPGYLVRLQRGNNPPQSCKSHDLQGAGAGLRSARRGHRPQRRGVDGAGGEQPHGQLRRAQVQGPERPGEARWQPVPRGVDALSDDGPEAERHRRPGRLPLLQLGGPVQHRRPRGQHPVCDRIEFRRAAGAQPADKEWTTLRVPYPLGFYSRGMDGRIDDARAGWKGRGLYANYGTHFVWHIEGGKGTKGKVVKFQIRPDPMAR